MLGCKVCSHFADVLSLARDECSGQRVEASVMLYTLPPIIMEVENGMSPILVSFHFREMFHIYDYGRKGMSIPSRFWLTNQIK